MSLRPGRTGGSPGGGAGDAGRDGQGPADPGRADPGRADSGLAGPRTGVPGQPRPRRVRVTSPRTRAARSRQTTITREIDAQTQIGEVYMRSLVRSQLRLALLVLAVIGGLLTGLPVVFAAVPPLRELHLFGLPVAWLLLGVVVHPVLVSIAWFYCRQAERTEREFAELVQSEPPTRP